MQEVESVDVGEVKMGRLTDLETRALEIEDSIISEYGSNRKTFELLMAIGRYKSEGGKKDLMEHVIKGEIYHRLPSNTHKISYIRNGTIYIRACELFFRLRNVTESMLRVRGNKIVLNELMRRLRDTESSIFKAYDMSYSMVSPNEVKLTLAIDGSKVTKVYYIDSIHLVEAMYFDLIDAITGVRLDAFMTEDLLEGYTRKAQRFN